MKKFLTFSIIFVLVMLLAGSLVYASDVDMNLSATTNSDTAADSTVYGSPTSTLEDEPTSTDLDTTTTPDTTVTVGSSAALSSSSLTLSNILNIILIVLGILLVLFAIAILLRIR